MPGQACIFKAFRASFTLVAARYVTAGNAAEGGDLPLGEGAAVIQPVAQTDDMGLPGIEAGADAPTHLGTGIPEVQRFQHVVLHAEHIHQREGAAVPLGIQTFGQGQLPLQLPLGAEVHEDLIFNASAGIGGQAHVFVRLEGGHPLDEADGTDGEQVVLISALGVVFFDDVRHQAQVMLNELAAGIRIPPGHSLQQELLLLPLEGGRKRPRGPRQTQGEKQSVEREQQPCRPHSDHLRRSVCRPCVSL